MKQLSRFEMAAVKRTAQNIKGMRNKKEKLEEKQAFITAEINQLEEMINNWEEPIVKMTGGFTSQQVLDGEMEIKHESIPGGSILDDSPLEEILVGVPSEKLGDEITVWEHIPSDNIEEKEEKEEKINKK